VECIIRDDARAKRPVEDGRVLECNDSLPAGLPAVGMAGGYHCETGQKQRTPPARSPFSQEQSGIEQIFTDRIFPLAVLCRITHYT
jgi:hypothetical protein